MSKKQAEIFSEGLGSDVIWQMCFMLMFIFNPAKIHLGKQEKIELGKEHEKDGSVFYCLVDLKTVRIG